MASKGNDPSKQSLEENSLKQKDSSKENDSSKPSKEKNGKQPKVKDVSKQMKELKVKEPNDIYILLLGDRSVGKSTFINAVANWVSLGKLKEANPSKVKVLIRSRFTIRDKSSAYPLVHVGDLEGVDVNKPEAFATDCIKTYVIPLAKGKSTKLHLIDTPGFGGPDMLYKNQAICEDVLNYIVQLQEIHGICCMFSPTDSFSASTFFDYIVKEILSKIDKNAFNNLLFGFTKTKSTEFTPGEAWWTLNNQINQYNDNPANPSKIEFGNRNTFCFENDFFKYLAAKRQGLDVDESAYVSSWQHTSQEIPRMLAYLTGRPKPILLKNLSSVAEATRLIINVSQPIFDALELVHDNIALLEKRREDITSSSLDLDDLKKKLYLSSVDWEVAPLLHPATMCFNFECCEPSSGLSIFKKLCRKKCHEDCFLTKVAKGMIGSVELLECEKLDEKKCKECGCDFSAHVRLYYLLKWSETKNNMGNDLKTIPEILAQREKLNKDIDLLLNTYNKEREELIKCVPMFAHFLENTSVLPYTATYKEYIAALINKESRMQNVNPEKTMAQLRALEEYYAQQKLNYDQALENARKLGDDKNLKSIVTAQNVIDTVLKLYSLSITGKKIKQLMKIQKPPRTKEFEKSILKPFEFLKINKDKANDEPKKKFKDKKNLNSQSASTDEKKQSDKKESQKQPDGGEVKPGASGENKDAKSGDKKKKDKKDKKKDDTGDKKDSKPGKAQFQKTGPHQRKFNQNKDTPPPYEALFQKQAAPPPLQVPYNPSHPSSAPHNPPHPSSPHHNPHSSASTPVTPTVEVKVYNNPVQAGDHAPPVSNYSYPAHNPYPSNPGNPHPPNVGGPHYGNPHPSNPGNPHYGNPGNPHPPYYGAPHQGPPPPVGFNPGPPPHPQSPYPGPAYGSSVHGPTSPSHNPPPYPVPGPHGVPHVPPHGPPHGMPHHGPPGPHQGSGHHFHGHGEPAHGPYQHGDCKECKHQIRKEKKKFKHDQKKKHKQEKREKKAMKKEAKKKSSSSSSSSSSDSD